MRKKGIIALLVLAVLFVAISLLLTDRWMERRIEGLGTSIVGAKVELDGFHLSLLKLSVRWDSLQVTNPNDTWTNLIAAGRTEFRMQALPLLRKKIIINNMQLSGVRSGVKRSTDGKVEKKIEIEKEEKPTIVSKTVQRLQAEMTAAPAWNLDKLAGKVNLDSILAILEIESPSKIDSVKDDVQNRYAVWEKTFTEKNIAQEIKDIELKITGIKPQELKTAVEIQNALTTTKEVKTRIDDLQSWVKTTKNGFSGDLSACLNTVTLADDWIRQDYERAMAKANLPDINVKTIGKFIFGSRVVNQVTQILDIAGTVRYYSSKLKSDKPEKEKKPPRFKGQTIHFPLKHPVPDFWIKNIELSGRTENGIRMSGQVTDIVSQQAVVGRPTIFNIKGSRADKAALALTGEFNYLDEPQENFNLTVTNISLTDMKLAESPLLPYPVSNGSGTFTTELNIGASRLSFHQGFKGSDVVFAIPAETAGISKKDRIVRSVLRKASTVTFDSGIKSNEDYTDFSLNSNLDELFVAELRSLASGEIQNARKKIEEHVAAQVDKSRAALQSLVSEKGTALQNQYASYEQQVQEKVQMIEQKKQELEKRLEEEKQGIQDEAKKRLKGIF